MRRTTCFNSVYLMCACKVTQHITFHRRDATIDRRIYLSDERTVATYFVLYRLHLTIIDTWV